MAYRLGIASYHSHCFMLSIGTICDIEVSKESMSVATPYYLVPSPSPNTTCACPIQAALGLSWTFAQLFFVLTRAAMCRAQNGSEEADKLNTHLAMCIGDGGLPGPFRCVHHIRSHQIQFYSLSL